MNKIALTEARHLSVYRVNSVNLVRLYFNIYATAAQCECVVQWRCQG